MRAPRILFFILMLVSGFSSYAQKMVTAQSPDGQTVVKVTLSDGIYYDVVSTQRRAMIVQILSLMSIEFGYFLQI